MSKLVIINPHTIQWCISGIGQVLFPLLREVKHELKKGLQQFKQIFPSKCVARSTGLQATCDNKSILKTESGDIWRVWGGTKLPFVTKELQITLANTAKLQKQQLFFFKLPSSLILGKTSKTCCEMLWGFSISLKHLEIPDSPRQRRPILQEQDDISVATRPKKLPQPSPQKKHRNAMTKYFRSLPSAVEWWPRW